MDEKRDWKVLLMWCMQELSYLRTAIKGKEPKEEDESAQGCEWHRVSSHVNGLAVLGEAASSRPDHDASDQGAGGAQQVDNTTPSKVRVAKLAEPARFSPCPVGDDGIHPTYIGASNVGGNFTIDCQVIEA